MNVGDTVEMAIESVAFGGEGVGRIDNRVVFVPFTVDGDVVAVKINEVRKRYARGDVTNVAVPSPKRTDPRCAHYHRCGGCHYQHINYVHQAEIKQQQVIDVFQRIGKVSHPPVSPTIKSPMIYNYRGKAEYHVKGLATQTPVVGFMDLTGASVIDIDRCEIVHESINDTCRRFRKDIDARKRTIRETRKTFWSAEERDSYDAESGTSLKFPIIKRSVKNRVFPVPAAGFFQINLSLIDTLVDQVVMRSSFSLSDVIMDCYCGSGLFALFLSPRVREVRGIEMSGKAVRCARTTMQHYEATNVSIIEGSVEDVLRFHTAETDRIDGVLLDPPRTGCTGETLARIIDLKPRRIVYVSCNPATQARDARVLMDGGFHLVELQPLDMFPQTKHVEVIAVFDRLHEGMG
ncbi:MAG: class I SAM-dependent RNA methyltransferase [Deltaproteobacteria bacterium]|nr:class I SAM-dependent RNA methyltransferase [Deltaproteobacteria bacterium]